MARAFQDRFDCRYRLLLIILCATLAAGAGILPALGQETEEPRWWRGNLHTHSVWSDGDDFPEMIADWYKENGYHFVAFTEHNLLQEGDQWYDINGDDEGWPPRARSMREALPGYRARFGTSWVEERREGDEHRVRIKPLSEFRHLFEEPGRFLLLMGEEITDHMVTHLNAIHVRKPIAPQGGGTVTATLRNNVDAVRSQREETGQPMFVFINHPNFRWALTAEDIAETPGAMFFEVYNGHGLVNNEGDDSRAGTERIWDIVLALRHAAGHTDPMYGLATDDAHNYRQESDVTARPGRGWVMVRAPFLTPESIVAAMEAGEFYASTGVELRDIRQKGSSISIEIEPEEGVRYSTQFIGTRRGFSTESAPVLDSEGMPVPTTRIYSADIGEVLAEVEGIAPAYDFAGDEIYIRARVISSKPKRDPTSGQVLGVEAAWTQPVFRP